ncbi:hypothetical protein [Labrys neptuniae]
MLTSPSQTASPSARRSSGAADRNKAEGEESIGLLALILALLSVGETRIEGLVGSRDVVAMAEACRRLGAAIERGGDAAWCIRGVGVGGLLSPEGSLDFGGSLAGAVLMMGVIASHGITATLDGDATLRTCPMMPVLTPLTRMGAEIVAAAEGVRLPLTLRGAVDPVPILWHVPDSGASSPVPPNLVSAAVLLAGLNAPGETAVIAPQATSEAVSSFRSPDDAAHLLRLFGADVAISPEGTGRRIVLQGRPTLRPAVVTLPAKIPPSSP